LDFPLKSGQFTADARPYGEPSQQCTIKPCQRSHAIHCFQASVATAAEERSATFGHGHAEEYGRRTERQQSLKPQPLNGKKDGAMRYSPNASLHLSWRLQINVLKPVYAAFTNFNDAEFMQ
jgi:hypothetical protein